jgi:hypothetical protein
MTTNLTASGSGTKVQMSEHAITVSVALSPIALKLMLHLASRMDEENRVDFDIYAKRDFIELLSGAGKRISLQSIHNAIQELKKFGLLTGINCSFVISRKYFKSRS